MKPATDHDIRGLDAALILLRVIRADLVDIGAPKAADAVRRAIKSVEGARRHACRRLEA